MKLFYNLSVKIFEKPLIFMDKKQDQSNLKHHCDGSNCRLSKIFSQMQKDKKRLEKERKTLFDPNFINGKFIRFDITDYLN